MERKLGIIAHCLKDIDVIDALEKMKNAGFETFFTASFGSVSKTAEIKKEQMNWGLHTNLFTHHFMGSTKCGCRDLDILLCLMQ